MQYVYLDLIKGNLRTTSKGTLTEVFIDKAVVDFGSFSMEEKQEGSFVLTNTGKGLFVIQDITTSCGCTKVEYSREPVRSGGKMEVKVTYEAEEAGHFNKSVMMFCNTEKSPIRLQVKGDANS